MASSTSRANSFLSDGLTGALHRRLAELIGLALILIAAAAMAALASWSALDPSFNLATDGPTRNLLGRIGAHRVKSLVAVPPGGVLEALPHGDAVDALVEVRPPFEERAKETTHRTSHPCIQSSTQRKLGP